MTANLLNSFGTDFQKKVLYNLLNDENFFTWQTTVVTEVLEVVEDLSYIKFKTKNSTYELFKL